MNGAGDEPLWPSSDEATRHMVEEAALKLCGGDAALWFHHRALLKGEQRAGVVGKKALARWQVSKLLPQYGETESSVIEGWRRFIQNTLRIPRAKQADKLAVNRAIILDGWRRAGTEEHRAKVLSREANAIRVLAASGDVAFFRSLGRLLNSRSRSSLGAYNYAHAMLSHWLTSYLWLMRGKTASDWLAASFGACPETAREGDRVLRHFNATKHAYGLKSRNPSLIDRIEPNGDLKSTAEGRELLASLFPRDGGH